MDRSVRCFKNSRPRAELLEKASTSWVDGRKCQMGHRGVGVGVAGEEASEKTLLLGSSLTSSPFLALGEDRDVLMSPTGLRRSGYCSAAVCCLPQGLCPAMGHCSITAAAGSMLSANPEAGWFCISHMHKDTATRLTGAMMHRPINSSLTQLRRNRLCS